ncbi:MAG: hypothetical protein ACFFDF_23785 [Candidatus Odinarchaeota archaeon]
MVNIFPPKKLSKKLSNQQKAILKYLYDHYENKFCHICNLSWHIAETFNTDQNKRIRDITKEKKKLNEQYNRESENLFNKNGTFKDEKAHEKWSMAYASNLFGLYFLEKTHRQKQLLTPTHRASLSRSLKRLWVKRHLIECITSYNKEEMISGNRTNYLFLTEKGKEVCRILFSENKSE